MRIFLAICMVIGVLLQGCAQKKLFIRVYDPFGDKISKGYINDMDSSELYLMNNQQSLHVIEYSEIGKIKLYRHPIRVGVGVAAIPVLVGTSLVLSGGGFIGLGMLVSGLEAGGVVTAIIAITNPKTLRIDSNMEKWKVAKAYLKERKSID